MAAQSFETVIVGGGQAGLAAGYHLQRQGRSFVILDASERVGDPWRKRWDSLRLYSPASYDGLPGLRFPAKRTAYPTTHEMADYLEAYAAHFELPVRSGTAVDMLTREGDRYVLTAGDQTFEADNVVVATGVMQKPYVPSFAPELDPRITQLHSNDYRNVSQLQEGPCSSSARATRGRTSPTRSPRSTKASSRESTTDRSRSGSTRAADAWAFACSRSPASTSSRWTRRWAARCGHTSGTAALRCCGTGGRICSRLVSSGRSHGRWACRTAGQCSTTAESSTSGTSSGAPGSGPTSRGSTFRSRWATTATPCSTAAPSTRLRALLRGTPVPALVHVDAGLRTGRDTERVVRHIASQPVSGRVAGPAAGARRGAGRLMRVAPASAERADERAEVGLAPHLERARGEDATDRLRGRSCKPRVDAGRSLGGGRRASAERARPRSYWPDVAWWGASPVTATALRRATSASEARRLFGEARPSSARSPSGCGPRWLLSARSPHRRRVPRAAGRRRDP